MKFSSVFSCAVIFGIFKSQFGASTGENLQDVAKFVGDLVQDATESNPQQAYDIALLHIESEPQNDLFELIVMEIGSTSVLLTFSILNPSEMQILWRIPMIIIVTDGVHDTSERILNQVMLEKPFSFQSQLADYLTQIFGTKYEVIEACLILVMTTKDQDAIRQSNSDILGLGMTNYIIIYEEDSWKIFTLNVYGQYGTIVELAKSAPKLSDHFPDKQKNLEGYAYKVALIEQYPKIRSKSGASGDFKLDGVNIKIFSEIAKHQGGSLEVVFMGEYKNGSKTPLTEMNQFVKYLVNGKADLTLNTAINIPHLSYRSIINTYDVVAYCAVVPVPPRLSFLRFLLTPYDAPSWLALGLAVSVSAWLWRFLFLKNGNSNSASHFLFGIFGNFLGQAIPFGATSRMQTLLLYLCILMTFILGSAYQSIILSLIYKSREGERFRTFDELFLSNMTFHTDSTFATYLEHSQHSVDIGRFKTDWAMFNGVGIWNRSFNAAIIRCDALEFEFSVLVDTQIYDQYYMLPEILFPMYEKFLLGFKSSFYAKLQRYYDLIFESGIRQHIERLLEIKNENLLKSQTLFMNSEGYLFNMDDLIGGFLILIAGHAISFAVFIYEVFPAMMVKFRIIRRTLLKFFRSLKNKLMG